MSAAPFFQLPQTQDERVKCLLANYVCFADEGKAYLYRSNGRRRTGRKIRYWVHLSNGRAFSLTADNDREAIYKANARIQPCGHPITDITDITDIAGDDEEGTHYCLSCARDASPA